MQHVHWGSMWWRLCAATLHPRSRRACRPHAAGTSCKTAEQRESAVKLSGAGGAEQQQEQQQEQQEIEEEEKTFFKQEE
ncbi:hypothetical protein JOB18_017184 [Solea senegalensis]|uniref:Uncharacterized protein n=1 Tax=Solea senegalensis TaxID=28829 RepID=A0AAV6PBZ8_SOLSE|nr:hypothetical protein JOB18_017184 [Solea senegalensis]